MVKLHVGVFACFNNEQALVQRVRSGSGGRRSLRLCCAYPLITNADAGDWTAADRFEALPQIFTSRVCMRTEAEEHTPERARTNAMPLFDNVSQ